MAGSRCCSRNHDSPQYPEESRHHKREILARKRSEQLQFYAYFWKKYDRILESLPISIFDENFRLEDANDPDALMVSLRSYFDLCTQEFFMHQQGLIEEVIWENWSRGLLACMELEVFKQAYSRLKVKEVTSRISPLAYGKKKTSKSILLDQIGIDGVRLPPCGVPGPLSK